jgi:23S rRNA pseudouridine1911/1915/1917 synthase
VLQGRPNRQDDGVLSTAFECEIDAQLAGKTLAEVVRAQHAPEPCSWNQARELCKRGKVSVNGSRARDAALRVKLGDRVALNPVAPRRREHVLPADAVIYEDAQVVVVNKPAGLLSIPFDAQDKNTLLDRLQFSLRRSSGARGSELGVVHRLDKDTTGLMVFARTLAAKRALQELFRRHDIERRYLALAHGQLAARRFETDLVPDRGDGLRGSFGQYRRARGAPPKGAQHAITDVRPLEVLRGATLVECRLSTGRQHQIRIHLSEAGHPILGEQVYIRDFPSQQLIAAERPMLHAAVLGFVHPKTGRALNFELEPPSDFVRILAQLRESALR